MYYISTIEQRSKEHAINYKIETSFRIGLYLNFGNGGMSNSKPNSLVY